MAEHRLRDPRVPVAVVDYGAGNLVSVTNALTAVGADVTVVRRGEDLRGFAGVVVPGVGASRPAMVRLRRYGLVAAIREALDEGVAFLGICLGLQLLFERSQEDGARGLAVLTGDVRAVPAAPRLPHVGWNTVERVHDHPLLEGIADGAAFYFVHSYAGVPSDPAVTVAETEHGGRFPSVCASGRVMGVQFHPERSGTDGVRLLANFVRLAASA